MKRRWTRSRVIRTARTGRSSTKPKDSPSSSSARHRSPRSWSSISAAARPRRAAAGGARICPGVPWSSRRPPGRALLPGSFGFGSGVQAWLDEGSARVKRERVALLAEMAREWPFFRTLLSNMEMVLAKADLAIGARYAQLAHDRRRGAAILASIRREWTLTTRHVLATLGARHLLESKV